MSIFQNRLCRRGYEGMIGKYGAYFLSDGEMVYIDPNDKDVIYLD